MIIRILKITLAIALFLLAAIGVVFVFPKRINDCDFHPVLFLIGTGVMINLGIRIIKGDKIF